MISSMNKVTRHFIIPSAATTVFFGFALMPVGFLGSRLRGVIAVSIAIAAGLLGIAAVIRAVIGRVCGDGASKRIIQFASTSTKPESCNPQVLPLGRQPGEKTAQGSFRGRSLKVSATAF